MKSIAGANPNIEASTRQLAAWSNMSVGMVVNAKRELIEASLIRVTPRPQGQRDLIQILDIWAQNFIFFFQRDEIKEQQLQLDLKEGSSFVHYVNSAVQNMNSDLVHNMNDKKEHDNGNKNKSNNRNTHKSFYGSDLQGPSAIDTIREGVCSACHWKTFKELTPRDKAEVNHATEFLMKENSGLAPIQTVRRVQAFTHYFKWKFNQYPTPNGIERQWSNFVLWCQQNIPGRLPTEETFKGLKANGKDVK